MQVKFGEKGMVASDLLPFIRKIINYKYMHGTKKTKNENLAIIKKLDLLIFLG